MVLGLLLSLALLPACKSLTPMQATQLSKDDTYELIVDSITDPAKADQLLALLNSYEAELVVIYDERVALNKELVELNKNYDTTRDEMQKVYDTINDKTQAIARLTAKLHTDMQKHSTA